jgi:glycosyltransferase involved in cell wall biosynthesis
MTRVAILSPANPSGDAVGNDIREMRRILVALGHDVDVFTAACGPREPRSRHGLKVTAFLGGDPTAIALFHHATGWDVGVRLMTRLGCRRVVRYHNVTPPDFFRPYDAGYAAECVRGREQLGTLVQSGCDLYLSASAFNQREIVQLGAPPERCAVVPPLHQVERMAAVEADPDVLDDLGDGHTNLLFVGRLVPHKGHRLLIDTFAIYHHCYNPASRLIIVGRRDDRLGAYTAGLREQVRGRGLRGRVVFVNEASEAALRAYYQATDVFLVASEHEGFCVPVVEAMSLGLPVVALGAAALPETVGEAGLVWEAADPFLLAESVARVVGDRTLREELRRRALDRYREHYQLGQLEVRFLQALGPLLGAPAPGGAEPVAA